MIGHRGVSGAAVIVAPPTLTLQALALSASSLTENSAAGMIVGAIQNTTTGSALSLSDTAGNRFAISGSNIVAGATATNYETATSHSITIVETLSGAAGTPKSTTLTITVVNVFEQPNLGTLTFSATTFLTASSASGTIGGATSGSTITASGLPTGLTINGPARTWAWAGGSAATGSFTLTETLADSANSPIISTINYTIAATPGTLQVLTLSASTIAENSAAGTVVGTVQNVTGGSALSLSDTAGSRFAVSGGNIVAGSVSTNYESATTHNITIVETLTGATGNPKSTTIAITVTNVFEQPSLVPLVFSSTTFLTDAAASGSIIGATSSSTVTAAGLPTGLSINGPLRTWAWDGTGSISTGTFTLTETLSDSANSPRDTTISYAIAALAQPTLTNFSALGTSPVTLEWSTTDYVAGLRAQLQVATDSGFSTITQNIIFFIDGASWALADKSIGLISPAGTYYARIRVLRDNESGATTVTGFDTLGTAVSFPADVSPFSPPFTDTINVSVATLNTVNGTAKNTGATVSGGGLTYTAAANGAFEPVRATIVQQSTLAQLEFTVTAVGTGKLAIGYDDGPTNNNFTGFIAPGVTNSHGIAVNFNNASDIQVCWNSQANAVVLVSGLGGSATNRFAVGDVYTLILNTSAHTLALWRTRSGSTTQVGSTATGLPTLSTYYNYIAGKNGEAGTVNYGASTFSKALSGDNFYG